MSVYLVRLKYLNKFSEGKTYHLYADNFLENMIERKYIENFFSLFSYLKFYEIDAFGKV